MIFGKSLFENQGEYTQARLINEDIHLMYCEKEGATGKEIAPELWEAIVLKGIRNTEFRESQEFIDWANRHREQTKEAAVELRRLAAEWEAETAKN